jgi:DNA repair protein RadC
MTTAQMPEPIPLPSDLTRLRTRLLSAGSAAVRTDELLAVLLGGRDALAAGRAALDQLGRAGIREAGPDELVALPGWRLDRAAAVLAGMELARRCAAAWPDDPWQVRTPGDIAEQLLPVMGSLPREELRVLLLNTKNVVTAESTVYVGNLAGSAVRVGEVFRDAVRRDAAAIVVVHNHPSGDPAPSSEDLRITGELASAGRLLDIELLDHLVIGRDRWISLRALGAVAPPRD